MGAATALTGYKTGLGIPPANTCQRPRAKRAAGRFSQNVVAGAEPDAVQSLL